MAPGQKLIAKDPYIIREDGKPRFTVGKEYIAEPLEGFRLFKVVTNLGETYHFGYNELETYFKDASQPEPTPAPSLGTWYPIESAPKDGTVFIGLEDDEVYKMKWVTGIPPVDSCFRLSDGNIHKIHIWGGEFEYKYPNPTHWTPLPELPKE